MKLLLDQHLSPRLVRRLADLFPDSDHVANLGFAKSIDTKIWNYARDNEFILVTKDANFADFSIIWGFPPKVIWIRRGNCTSKAIELILRNNHDIIGNFESDDSTGVLALF